MTKIFSAFFLFFFFSLNLLGAQEFQGNGPYLHFGGQYYLPTTQPLMIPGARLGGGWEFPMGPGDLDLGIETGFTFTYERSASPASFCLIPLMVSGTYALHISRFSINLGGAMGGMIILSSLNDKALDFAVGPRIQGEFRFGAPSSRPLWSLYLGGGLDVIIEKDSAFFMPDLELGVRIRFGTRSAPASPSPKKPSSETSSKPKQTEKTQEKSPKPESPKGPLVLVYFKQDSTEPLEEYQGAFSVAGLYLLQNPNSRLVLRGYSDPAEESTLLARDRAQYCADYLIREYGATRDRITIEYFGRQKTPLGADDYASSRRAVEFFKEEDTL
ncbi:MAG: hypothetical protein LBG90_03200 [Spirochaetaceae bacterium]|jgi:outer membrane protein OmpA-like peptidoglycan-associated protein|nr:hypothetical protein [Spirochaetaceae bacterium]